VTSFWIVLLAAGAMAIAGLMLVPTLTGIPRERWAAHTLRPIVVQIVVGSLAAGMTSVAFRAPPTWALGFAAFGGTLAILRFGHRYTPMRRIKRLTRALSIDSERARAIAEIGPELDRGRPTMPGDPRLAAWAHAALVAAAYLIDADEPEAARGVLERTSGIVFNGISLANRALIWAHVEVFANATAKARSALDSVPRTLETPLLAAHRDGLEALVLACEGDGLGALSRVEAWKYADSWYGKLRLTARAVAHASRGETALRERTEHEIERRFGARAAETARALANAHAAS